MHRLSQHVEADILIKKTGEQDLFGSWKVSSCESLDGPYECLAGTEFRLDEGGDLIWKVPPTADPEGFPFFLCETFEYIPATCQMKCYGPRSEWVEFKCSFDHGELVLACDSYIKLHCIKVEQDAPLPSPPYSLLNALNDGFFTDIALTSTNGQKFHVHKTVLSCTFTAHHDWDIIPSYLEGLSTEVLQSLLHYLYSGSLPEDLSKDTCKQLQSVAVQTQGLTKLSLLCAEFLEATALKNRITGLLDDISNVVDQVSGRILLHLGDPSHQESSTTADRVSLDPATLSQIARTTFQETATGLLKFILLCEIFTKRKVELGREERHEVIHCVKARLPSLSKQLLKLLLVCRDSLSHVSATQQEEIVACLIPEIEAVWDICTKFGMDAETALDHILQRADGEHKKKSHTASVGRKLGRSLRNALHLREVMTLKRIRRKTTSTFVFLLQKREDFSALSEEGKVRVLIRTARKLSAEIPDYVDTLSKFPRALEDKMTWKEWKHAFKVWTARVSWVLGKVVGHRETLDPLIQTICHLVNQDSFGRTAAELGLLITPTQEPQSGDATAPEQPDKLDEEEGGVHVNCVTTPPPASENGLALAVGELLSSGDHADLTFVLGCGRRIDHGTTERERGGPQVIKAHRVIVAARCDWFRRALLSGMKESIDREISIPDTDPDLFREFLRFLYRGLLNTNSMSVEKLADLMALSDRYETDSLKKICEISLVRRLGEDSALFLLNLADHYNAPELKGASLAYVAANPGIMHSEVFDELPSHLQTQVEIKIQENMQTIDPFMEDVREAFAVSILEESEDSGECAATSRLGGNTRVEQCIEVLSGILGDSVPRRDLVRVALAADCDPNRAINFYFAS